MGGASSRLNVSNFLTAGDGSDNVPPVATVRAVASSLTLPGTVTGTFQVVDVAPGLARGALTVFEPPQVVRSSWRYWPLARLRIDSSTRFTPPVAEAVPLTSNSLPESCTRPLIGSVIAVSTPLGVGTLVKSKNAMRPMFSPAWVTASPPVNRPREVATIALLPS